jgi:ElaA protein
MNWTLKKFDELTVHELYSIMRVRAEVFVVEQNCAYQDIDNKDQLSYHLCGWEGNQLVAYTRLLPPGLSYTEASIGRVLTVKHVRGSNAGRALMQESIRQVYHLFGEAPIKIGAQLYLKRFYESFGFVQSSDVYDEDGIQHIEMMKEKNTN